MPETPEIILIAHNLRSCHNVGSLLRTAEGLGVKEVIMSGYTPFPRHDGDGRLPHLAAKIDQKIHKTALGAELFQAWRQADRLEDVLDGLRRDGYSLAAIEQDNRSTPLPAFQPPAKVALLVGPEVEGFDTAVLDVVDHILEIPMSGRKESFNVVQAAAMALYHCRFAIRSMYG